MLSTGQDGSCKSLLPSAPYDHLHLLFGAEGHPDLSTWEVSIPGEFRGRWNLGDLVCGNLRSIQLHVRDGQGQAVSDALVELLPQAEAGRALRTDAGGGLQLLAGSTSTGLRVMALGFESQTFPLGSGSSFTLTLRRP